MPSMSIQILIAVQYCSAGASGQGNNGQEERMLIIGGTEAVVGRYPYAVLLRNSSNRISRCGGSLIARDVVLSAAHCKSAWDYTVIPDS
jgi:secreted trypsin-like serine protease